MRTSLIYLSGPITGGSYSDATDWRNTVSDTIRHENDPINIQVVSPMRHREYLLQETNVKDGYDDHILSCGKAIVARNKFDINRSDLIIMNFLGAKKASIGSMLELGWANASNVPVICVMDEENVHSHAMVREVSSIIAPNINEAIVAARSLLIPGI